MKVKTTWAAIAALFLILSFFSCSRVDKNTPEGRFGKDKHYFLALKSLQEDNEPKAVRHLKKGIRHSSDFLARKSMEKLSTIGTVSEKISTSSKYLQEYKDEEALLRYSQELFIGQEYAKIISITNKLLDSSNPELYYLRFASIAEKKLFMFSGEIEDWFFHTPFSSFHKKFFTDYKDFLYKAFPSETILHMQLRLAVYNGDVTKDYSYYTEAQKIFFKFFISIEDQAEWLSRQSPYLILDIGKSLVFGGGNSINNANLFNSAANIALDNNNNISAFYLFFYSGRLYDRSSSSNTERALTCFKSALKCAPLPENHDNALWYYFTTSLKISPERAIRALEKYVSTIHDPWYYTDFFETLIHRLITDSEWNYIVSTFNLIKDYADPDTISKYAYISGRLLQQGYISTEIISRHNAQDQALKLFSVAFEPGGLLYYRILAAYQLGIPQEKLIETIFHSKLIQNHQPNLELEYLLEGFIAFSLPEEVYPLWQSHKDYLSLEIEGKAAEFLAQQHQHKFSTQGMRIIANAIHHADIQPTEDLFQLAYPRLFAQEVTDVCNEFGLDEYLFYALIRTESFFDSVVYSYKGAQGLTQLMPATAGDVAKKLKVTEYDLSDPKTNLRFGAKYLSDLIDRTDNSILDSLSAYNAGLKRVRNWKEVSPNVPQDIFLEMIPFTETRDYGRKVTSGAVIYALLYYDVDYTQVVSEIMGY